MTVPYMDLYEQIPKNNLVEHTAYRIQLRERCTTSLSFREQVCEVCSKNPLIFFATFGWIFEPRVRKDNHGRVLPKIIPFVLWDHQEPVILEIFERLGEQDIVVRKSRGEGATWIAVWLMLHNWVFGDNVTMMCVSKSMDSVYNGKDPRSIFWKIDFGRQRLPAWLTGPKSKVNGWERNLTDNTLSNNRRNNIISGFPATATFDAGGRAEWIFWDELSKFPRPADSAAMESTMSVTDCRLIVGTPYGSTGAYYDAVHSGPSTVKLTLHWSANPSKNRGLYRLIENRPVAVEPLTNPLRKDYDPPSRRVLEMFDELRARGYVLTTGVRSPWYDSQCQRLNSNPRSIAQELDIDFGGSIQTYFGGLCLENVQKSVLPPVKRGNLVHFESATAVDYEESDGGVYYLWFEMGIANVPPIGDYIVACDIGSGMASTYTSNSTIVVFNTRTGEQVAEFAANNIQQPDFAELAVATAKFFHNALLGWEANYAFSFTEHVRKLGYGRILYRPSLFKRYQRYEGGKPLGWWTDERSKKLMFDDAEYMIRKGDVVIRSEDLRKEMAEYIVDERGSIEFQGYSGDKSHGDRVIAACVAIYMLKEHKGGHAKNSSDVLVPPQGTVEYREYLMSMEEKQRDDFWDHTTPSDLLGVGGGGMQREREEHGWD